MKTETVLMLGCKVGTLLLLQTATWGSPPHRPLLCPGISTRVSGTAAVLNVSQAAISLMCSDLTSSFKKYMRGKVVESTCT